MEQIVGTAFFFSMGVDGLCWRRRGLENEA
jgi:hypothetical protein